jgi:3-oxoacyl-ACP reductase-like protein
MAATTAVVAGTAGAVSHHQQQKYANQEAEQQAQAQAAYEEGAAAAQQQAAAVAPEPAPAPAPASAGIDMAQLQQLADLHTAGVLTDEEFAASKAKILAGG